MIDSSTRQSDSLFIRISPQTRQRIEARSRGQRGFARAAREAIEAGLAALEASEREQPAAEQAGG